MNPDTQNKKAFIFIGRSGCGKGTQAKLLIEDIKSKETAPIYYLESGENFRKFIQGDSFSSNLSKKVYEDGTLQPEFLAVWTWSHLMVENLVQGENLVLDGTPRKVREANVLETAFDFYEYKNVFVFHINISREESVKRMIERGRLDDKDPKEIEKRLNWFDTDVAPTIEFYRNNPRYKFYEINGEREIEEVQKEIIEKVHP